MHEYDVQIRWQNFRSFKDTGWLQIKPITVLIGPNNSGKTSILAPLLLLNQTLNSIDGDHALITRGGLIDVGSYEDLIHNHEVDLPLSLAVGFHLHDDDDQNLDPVGDYPSGALEVTFDKDSTGEIALKKYQVLDIYKRPYLSRTRNRNGNFVLRGPMSTKEMSSSERRMLRHAGPTNFFFMPSSTLYDPEGRNHTPQRPRKFTTDFSHYIGVIGHVHMALQDFFIPLSYVGPIRAWPKRHYEVLSEGQYSVGTKGEHLAAVLHGKEQLRTKLDEWIQKFGFGERLNLVRLTEDFFDINFEDSNGQKTNIVDVGFGASQLLPLLVQGFSMAKRGAVFVAEQPEIHLNPRIQGTLADLFAEISDAGNRVIIETHSEHFLLRLRRLVAEGRVAPDHVALYFVERSDTCSSIREVPIEGNGHIQRDQWPKGFFQDALTESLALSSAQARKMTEKTN